MNNYIITNGQLYHHGIKGQKWGRRRYQNPDGSLTAAGRKRYGPEHLDYPDKVTNTTKRVIDDYNRLTDGQFLLKYKTSKKTYAKRVEKRGDPFLKKNGKPRMYDAEKWSTADELEKPRYGEVGAIRIRQRMEQKGLTRKQAERREFGRQMVEGILGVTAALTTAYIISNRAHITKGIAAAKNSMMDKAFNAAVLDSSGKVIRRFNMDFKVKDVANALVKR